MSTYEQFKIEGKIEADLRAVKRLSTKGFTIVEIADCIDLSIEEVKKLLEKIAQQ